MKVNAKRVAALAPKNLKQLEKKQKLQQALAQARKLARDTESTLATLRDLDNKESDMCDVKDVYLERSEDGKKTIEAYFIAGGRVNIEEQQEGGGTHRISIRDQGEYRVVSSSNEYDYDTPEMTLTSYSATEVTYKPGEADPTFKIRHYNSKPFHLAASGLRTLARTVGGFVGPIFEKLGSVRIKFEMSPHDQTKATGVGVGEEPTTPRPTPGGGTIVSQ